MLSDENLRRVINALGQPGSGGLSQSDDIHIIALIKGRERYVFVYDAERRAECLRVIGSFAGHLELSFSWYDAAVLSQKIRHEEKGERIRTNRLEHLL